MEALAARQMKKKQIQRAESMRIEAEAASAKQAALSSKSAKERNSLNKMLGFSDPPDQVFAIGKDGSAAVWWTEVEDSSITAWEVHRYRRDKSRQQEEIWTRKGHSTYPVVVEEGKENRTKNNQVIVDHLSNDYEYRFTVKAVNLKGAGGESDPSNGVMVETPLPNGWFRFYDKSIHRHYYANLRLELSSWTRPEEDPWFLDESVQLSFHPREIKALKALYQEEIAHFDCVKVDQFLDILREIGERGSKNWISKLFRGYAGNENQLKEWKHYMEVLLHIKKQRQMGVIKVANPLERLLQLFSQKKIKALLQPPDRGKLGDWKIEYNALAEKSYYLNTKTGESYWSMPPQVKFYIPPKLEDKLLEVFDFGDIEEFQQYFSMLDVDNSGDLSPKEIRLLLKSLDININENKFNKLIRTVDLNGNGTIEFDEYCWMMLQIYRKDNGASAFWNDLQSQQGGSSKKQQQKQQEQRQHIDDGSIVSEVSTDYTLLAKDNSVFQDKSWGAQLSYTSMRNALNTMKTFSSLSPGAGNRRGTHYMHRRNSMAGNFARLARSMSFSGTPAAGGVLGRQNSLTPSEVDTGAAAVGGSKEKEKMKKQEYSCCFRYLCFCCICCCCSGRRKNQNEDDDSDGDSDYGNNNHNHNGNNKRAKGSSSSSPQTRSSLNDRLGNFDEETGSRKKKGEGEGESGYDDDDGDDRFGSSSRGRKVSFSRKRSGSMKKVSPVVTGGSRKGASFDQRSAAGSTSDYEGFDDEAYSNYDEDAVYDEYDTQEEQKHDKYCMCGCRAY